MGAPIHQSLTETVLLLGMERKPALTIFIAAAALAAVGLCWYTLTLAALLLLLGPYCLGKLAQYDPQFETIYLRYSGYDRAYDPETPLKRRNPVRRVLAGPHRPSVPAPGRFDDLQ